MKLKSSLNCFKTYDVRGKLGEELDESIAYRIGRSTAQVLQAKSVVLGFDARETSPELSDAAAKGICDAGCDVLKIGLAGTEEMYCAVSELNADAGVEVTASHNPIEYNGLKIVKKGSQPLSEYEFASIKSVSENNKFFKQKRLGLQINQKDKARKAYLDKIISFVDLKSLKPLKIVINSGNGVAGPIIDLLVKRFEAEAIKFDFVLVHHMPDKSFPNGIPNPLLEENRSSTTDVIKREKADLGVAFDGDFDRCFFFDHLGNFIPGEYVVGLLSEVFLNKQSGSTIVHDPRVVWNTQDVVKNFGGFAISSKTGHSYIKKSMREVDAIYGGEMSAHHYFRDFFYCDSGMIPWLLMWEIISQKNTMLADLVIERKNLFPSSGEINFTISNPSESIKFVKDVFASTADTIDEIDGLSMSFKNWRFNLRKSNTEPLVRLNVETLGDEQLMLRKQEQLKNLIIGT